MNRINQRIYILALLLVLLASVSLALSLGTLDLLQWTVDSGGGISHGGAYTVAGTLGQAEVGQRMSGGAYTLAGGFWGAGAEAGSKIYLPVVVRQPQ
jgi:uncharacterized membrane protein